MEHLVPLFDRYGYLLLFGLGFVEFAGLPVASVPVLVLAGALWAAGTLHPAIAVAAVVAGGLLGDGLWFVLARARGTGIVHRMCGLATNPWGCVNGVRTRVARVGPAYILPAKFLPGTGNLIAAASGLGGIRPAVFFLMDLVALGLWATVYLALGRVFASTVEVAVMWASDAVLALTVTSVGLILTAGTWRLVKMGIHRRRHARAAEAQPPLVPSGVLASQTLPAESAETPL